MYFNHPSLLVYLLLPNFQVDFRWRRERATEDKTPATRGNTRRRERMPVSTENSTVSRSNNTSTRDNANDSTRGNDMWWESMSATGGISV